jgi:hypothetical protein
MVSAPVPSIFKRTIVFFLSKNRSELGVLCRLCDYRIADENSLKDSSS